MTAPARSACGSRTTGNRHETHGTRCFLVPCVYGYIVRSALCSGLRDPLLLQLRPEQDTECQAEVGVASAMAASAAVELMGGTPRKCTFAASTVLMNMLGLVCDPVGGLVEYPCQNRNAAGVANAVIAAEMALAGIRQLIPLDEMIQTMFTVGRKLPAELRETAMGGCAVTPSACEACHICR